MTQPLQPKSSDPMSFSSVEEWWESLGYVVPLQAIPDPTERQRRLREFDELTQKIRQDHLKTLSADERRQIENGEHPSQNWNQFKQAQQVLNDFRTSLAGVDFVKSVNAVGHPFNPVSFVVELKHPLPAAAYRKHIPPYFHGFKVQVPPPPK